MPGPQNCGQGPGGLFCCLSNVADCGQPDTVTYSCSQPSDGGPSCKGSAPVPFGVPNFQAMQTAEEASDNDASYALGCKATFPACNYGQPIYCTCSLNPTPTWSCFY